MRASINCQDNGALSEFLYSFHFFYLLVVFYYIDIMIFLRTAGTMRSFTFYYCLMTTTFTIAHHIIWSLFSFVMIIKLYVQQVINKVDEINSCDLIMSINVHKYHLIHAEMPIQFSNWYLFLSEL